MLHVGVLKRFDHQPDARTAEKAHISEDRRCQAGRFMLAQQSCTNVVKAAQGKLAAQRSVAIRPRLAGDGQLAGIEAQAGARTTRFGMRATGNGPRAVRTAVNDHASSTFPDDQPYPTVGLSGTQKITKEIGAERVPPLWVDPAAATL